jgi:hypothetical protein
MDSLLSGLFGDQDDDDKQRSKAQDFVKRYDEGPPYANITGEEALSNYQSVASRLSPQQLEDSAAEAYERMSPHDRQQFAQFLKERSGENLDQFGDDPRSMAQMTSQLQAQQPDGIAGLLGGVGGLLGGGGLGSMLGGNNNGGGLGSMLSGVLGGGDDNDRNDDQNQGGNMGDMLNNPVARAALGGIAAIAMKKMMS